MEKKDLYLKFLAWLSGAALYGAALLIYFYLPYYNGLLSKTPLDIGYLPFPHFVAAVKYLMIITGNNALSFIWHLYIYYLGGSFLWFFFYKGAKINDTKTLIFWQLAKRFLSSWKNFSISTKEKSVLLFFLVKLIFTPLMINFLFTNLSGFFINGFQFFYSKPMATNEQIKFFYFFIFYALLTVDTVYFSLGYLFEFKKWKNELRSVEPTLFGWAVALACYPPFNGLTSQILGWGTNDFSVFPSVATTLIAAVVTLLLYLIYVWATVALGLKSSNLTNRGIVSNGPYKYIRHPAYISKNLAWLVMGIPVMLANPFAFFSIVAWAFVYFLRAITEERHLLSDPDYQEYCKKVRYRFIPGVI